MRACSGASPVRGLALATGAGALPWVFALSSA